MKIGLLTASGGPDAPVPPHLLAAVGPGTTLALYPVRLATFAYSPAEFLVQQVNFVEAGLRAAADGCDRIVYVSVADYGIAALRALVDVPVIGAGETTYAALAASGTAFSVVTVWPESTNFVHDDLTRSHGARSLRRSIHNVTPEAVLAGPDRPDGFIARMQAGEQATFDAVMAACHAAADQDRAGAIVLGCTCMSPIAARIAAAAPLPVIDPFVAAVTRAESGDLSPLPCSPHARAGTQDLLRRMIAAVT
jgi:allantoin racemase